MAYILVLSYYQGTILHRIMINLLNNSVGEGIGSVLCWLTVYSEPLVSVVIQYQIEYTYLLIYHVKR